MKQIILFFLIPLIGFCQTQIKKPLEKTDKTIKPVFSNESDIKDLKKAEQFYGLIGTEIFFTPVNSKYALAVERFETIKFIPKERFKLNKIEYEVNQPIQLSRTNKELFDHLEIQGNYFIVDSIQFYDSNLKSKKQLSGYEFNQLRETYPTVFVGSIDLYTHHKETNQIIVFTISRYYHAKALLSVPFFDHLIEKYLNKRIILKDITLKNDLEHDSLEGNDLKALNPSQIYEVKKIILKEPESEYYVDYAPIFSLSSVHEDQDVDYYYDRISDKIILYDEFVNGKLKKNRTPNKNDRKK